MEKAFEFLILALHGNEVGVLAWAIGQHELDASMARFGADSPFTRLRLQLDGVDPDEAFSSIPYEKGARFVALIERAVGPERFAQFMQHYMHHFKFQSIISEEFLQFLEAQLPGAAAQVQAQQWLYAPGMPPNAPVFTSATLTELTALAQTWTAGQRPTTEQLRRWGPHEVLVFLQHLPRQLDHASLAWLDTHLGLTGRSNYEILVEWLTIAGGSDYAPVFGRLCEVLTRVGGMKSCARCSPRSANMPARSTSGARVMLRQKRRITACHGVSSKPPWRSGNSMPPNLPRLQRLRYEAAARVLGPPVGDEPVQDAARVRRCRRRSNTPPVSPGASGGATGSVLR